MFVSAQVDVSGCVNVVGGDRIGFSALYDVSPIAATYNLTRVIMPNPLTTAVRYAAATWPFDVDFVPYAFSLSASYMPGQTC